jgi:hypothetical protein
MIWLAEYTLALDSSVAVDAKDASEKINATEAAPEKTELRSSSDSAPAATCRIMSSFSWSE